MPNIQEISALFSANADGITAEASYENNLSKPFTSPGALR